MDNPKYRPINDEELIENIRRACEEEIERIGFYEEDCRNNRELLPERIVGKKSVYEYILNRIENREYIRKEIK